MYLLQVYKQTGNKNILRQLLKPVNILNSLLTLPKTVVHIIICMTLWLRMKATKIQSMLIFPMARRERRICGQCFMRQPEIKSIFEEQKKFLNILTE